METVVDFGNENLANVLSKSNIKDVRGFARTYIIANYTFIVVPVVHR